MKCLFILIASLTLTAGWPAVGADSRQDAERSLKQLITITNEAELTAQWRLLLSQQDALPVLMAALPRSGFSAWTAVAGLRALRRLGLVEPDFVLALASSAGLAEESENLTEADIQKLAARAAGGNPASGELIYRRKNMACMVCHAIAGAGGKVGPDLATIGTSNLNYIVESVLIPNKTIKQGYHSVLVTTKDDTDLAGVFVRETKKELVLRDANNHEIQIPAAEIASQRIGISLMPVGVVNVLSPDERMDLFRFLAELGKPGAFDATHTTAARCWRIWSETPVNEEEFLKSVGADRRWATVYSTVAGDVLKEDLQAELAAPHRTAPFYLATRLHVPRTGPVRFKLVGPTNPPAWINAKSIQTLATFSARLRAGTHTLVFKLAPQELPSRVRLDVSPGVFLTE